MATTTKQDTWREWLPVGAPSPTLLLTRDQIVQFVNEQGATPSVSARDLAYWESIGVLPCAVRQWHNDAVHAVYPQWYARLVIALRVWQQQGLTLTAIATQLRGLMEPRIVTA